jgi:hypothetical protein
MRRISVRTSVMIGILALSLTAAVAVAQSTKSVRGVVKAIGPASVTVSVDGKDMVFNVDAKTDITTPGGGSKTRAAQAQGKEGVKIADLLTVGQGVAVEYHEQGMHAAVIRTLAAPPPPAPPAGAVSKPPAPATQTANGVVTAVAGNSLTIKAASGEMTFTIDDKTDVVAAGASTTTRAKTAEGKKTVITDFVGKGDTVVVTYHDTAGSKHAAEVRVRTKGRT